MSWKHWSVNNMKKTGFTGYIHDFSVDYYPIAFDDIKDIHNYLIKMNDIVRNVQIYEEGIFCRIYDFIRFQQRKFINLYASE